MSRLDLRSRAGIRRRATISLASPCLMAPRHLVDVDVEVRLHLLHVVEVLELLQQLEQRSASSPSTRTVFFGMFAISASGSRCPFASSALFTWCRAPDRW